MYLWLFIVAALATFVLFCLVYFMVSLKPTADQSTLAEDNSRYYLNEDYSDPDAYITKEPDLSDMLKGPIITDSDPGTGDPAAPVVIVLYSDYLCGYCREEEATIQTVLDEYPRAVRLVWKDYPEGDPNSLSWQAAAGARCAGEQGQYRAYHDGLFGNSGFDESFILKLAQNLGLNIAQFKTCLASDRTKQAISDNIEEANALDINGIPFIYVNDQEVMGQAGYEDLKRLVEIELKKVKE